MAIREITVEDHLVNMCTRYGAWCPKSEPICTGFPDRMVIAAHNRIVFVETKAPDGKVSPIQNRMHRLLQALGCVVEVLWSREEVDRWAEEFFGGV